MERKTTRARSALKRPGKFFLRVLVGFQRNQGLLLAGAVAYYTLLSIIPMLALILVGLSHFVEEKQLYDTILTNLKLVIPQHAELVAGQVWEFFARRQLVGIFGILFMLFFSSLAFTVLENAMAVIFSHRARRHRRHFLISAIIPYAYIVLMGIGLLLVTLISGALGALPDRHVVLFGIDLSMEYTSRIGLYFSGMFGMIAILTSLYLVMPVGHVSVRYALAGGITASILWEVVRHILVWYYTNISLVNVIYGSLATAVVALLSIEIAVIILLFGAQVIAEFERSTIDVPRAGHGDFDI
ncbi:MAG: YihY/virulence factor BrkB family protein [Desulfobacterales bacterium]|nr:YihY/virulence factor BrkB family protein [Desulfobacterales bacterium]